MNCCIIIILLLLCGKGNTSCGNNCIQPRRSVVNDCKPDYNDVDSCPCSMNADSFGPNRFPVFNMKEEDCGCRN